MSEASVMQLAAMVAWPVVALIAILVFFNPLRRVLGELSGFVGRSYYRAGGIEDDWTLDRVSIKTFCGCGCNDKVFDKIREMREGGYSFAPIMGDGRVRAVFTPTCVQRIATGELEVDAEMNFKTLLERTKDVFSDMDIGEYRFVSVDDSVQAVRRHFAGKWNDKQDFGIVFVTKSGCPSERLEGILTVWDVVKK